MSPVTRVPTPLIRCLALFAIALTAVVMPARAALADYVWIRNPLWTHARITSGWNHGSSYGERAIDLTPYPYDPGGTSVYWRADNPHSSELLYYETYEYAITSSCHGLTYRIYHRPVSGGKYAFIGYANYVHIGGYTTGRTGTLQPGRSEARYIGYTRADCGYSPHLHHGHRSWDGLADAYWLSASVPSEDITLYR